MPAIFDPFRNITGGVVKTERIGFERADRQRHSTLTCIAVLAVGTARPEVRTPPICRARSCAGGIFPLSFGRKPIFVSGLLGQPCYKCLRVQPAHINDRTLAAAPAAIIGTGLTSALVNALTPF